MVEFRRHRTKTCLYVAQRFSKSQLRKCHAEELIETGKAARARIASVAADALVELMLCAKSISWEKMIRSVFMSQPFNGENAPKLGCAYTGVEIENNHFCSQPIVNEGIMLKSFSLSRTVLIKYLKLKCKNA